MKDQELQTTNNSKFYRIADPIVFVICMLNLALWLNRALYIRNDNVYPFVEYLAVDCLPALRIGLYVVPIMVLTTILNRKFSMHSFAALSIKCVFITLFLIYVLK